MIYYLTKYPLYNISYIIFFLFSSFFVFITYNINFLVYHISFLQTLLIQSISNNVITYFIYLILYSIILYVNLYIYVKNSLYFGNIYMLFYSDNDFVLYFNHYENEYSQKQFINITCIQKLFRFFLTIIVLLIVKK